MDSKFGTLPIFKSQLQADLLRLLYGADRAYSTSELVELARGTQPSVHRELRRLVGSGLILEHRIGRSSTFSVDESNPLTPALRTVLSVAVSPVALLRRRLEPVAGIELALVFGSFAARSAGLPGRSPDDIDLLIVGRPDRAELAAALDEVERVVHREVVPQIVSRQRWDAGEGELIGRIRSAPWLEVLPDDRRPRSAAPPAR